MPVPVPVPVLVLVSVLRPVPVLRQQAHRSVPRYLDPDDVPGVEVSRAHRSVIGYLDPDDASGVEASRPDRSVIGYLDPDDAPGIEVSRPHRSVIRYLDPDDAPRNRGIQMPPERHQIPRRVRHPSGSRYLVPVRGGEPGGGRVGAVGLVRAMG
ncbi:hypothetical protein [Nostocoides japonicum]|uniref:hypothetical protein n=1 Tax=Nostocoides japonicum TaxID=99481 RepID=UPI00138F592E|nr:hypothetical protein [Tetrasphaera japonica]